MKKSQRLREAQLLPVVASFCSFQNAAQIRPCFCWDRLGPTYRSSWRSVVALVLTVFALGKPSISLAADGVGELYDQQGLEFSQQQLRGNLSVVNFFFTSCPEACPTQMRKLRALYQKLPTVYGKPVNFVSFSVDPARDTQEVLANYAAKLQVDAASWRLVTGDPAALSSIRDEYGSVVKSIESNLADIDHSLIVYLQDAQERVVMTYVGADVNAERIQQDILTLSRLKRDIPLR